MSIIKPTKPGIQPRRQSRIQDTETKEDHELSKKEIKVVAGAGIAGLIFLFLIAWLLLPLSAKIIPFVVAGALPLFTLLAVIYQAIVYRRQWNVMQRSLRQTEQIITKMQSQLVAVNAQTDVMRKSLAESEKMTANAKDGLVIAQTNAEHAQRAYVTVVKCKIERRGDLTGFSLTFENSGNTPALEVSADVLIDAGMTEPRMPDGKLTDNYTTLGLLAPRVTETVFFPLGRELTYDEQKDFADPNVDFHWWCRGFIHYRDIFQRDLGDYWIVDFCFYFDRDSGKTKASSSGNEIKEYRKGQHVNPKLI